LFPEYDDLLFSSPFFFLLWHLVAAPAGVPLKDLNHDSMSLSPPCILTLFFFLNCFPRFRCSSRVPPPKNSWSNVVLSSTFPLHYLSLGAPTYLQPSQDVEVRIRRLPLNALTVVLIRGGDPYSKKCFPPLKFRFPLSNLRVSCHCHSLSSPP